MNTFLHQHYDFAGNGQFLWKVDADDSYQVTHKQFRYPGVFVTISGEGRLILLPDEAYRLGTGSFFAVSPDRPVHYACLKNQRWFFYFVFFEALSRITEAGLRLNTRYVFDTTVLARQTFERIIAECVERRPGYRLQAESLLNDFIVAVARKIGAGNKTRGKIEPARIWMERHLHRELDMDRLMRQCGMGRADFFAKFKAATGKPPLQFFLDMKLESARYMLETTTLPVKEISRNLAFYDEFHFSKVFKKKYGQAPRQYRAGMRFCL